MAAINMLSTIKGSLLENFYPKGWDLAKIDRCCSNPPETILDRQPWWHKDFQPVRCESIQDFDTMMGFEIAQTIRAYREQKREVVFILPVGPMGMYKWAVFFLKAWNIPCDHFHGFNMDEWSDQQGNTLAPDAAGSFQQAMEEAFYGPLGELTVPPAQRHFATKTDLPKYPEQIAALRQAGAALVVVFGIGRACHIAFWEPQYAGEFSEKDWMEQCYRLAAPLHPLTIEQNALTSFRGRYTLISCFANTIGPGLFLKADKIIGGCDGAFANGMQWQGPSLWITLRYGPDRWFPSTFMPTQPGRLFFLKDLAGPLEAECH
ncbi:MAG: 6-phosphogluconolactonase [bacterium]